jgi:hypothetical protein
MVVPSARRQSCAEHGHPPPKNPLASRPASAQSSPREPARPPALAPCSANNSRTRWRARMMRVLFRELIPLFDKKMKNNQLLTTVAFLLFALAITAWGQPTFEPFKSPDKCISIPTKAGFKSISDKPIAWREEELGWLSHTKIITHVGQLKKVGDVDNDISCFFSGEKDYIQYVQVKANCYNTDGAEPTIKKFREVVELLGTDLGIDSPKDILKNVDPAKGKVIEAATYKITIKKLPYKIGYGWIFKLETK